MIDKELFEFLKNQPIKLTLKTICNLLQQITGKKILVVAIEENENKMHMYATKNIIANYENINSLHEYFCKQEIILSISQELEEHQRNKGHKC